MDLKSGIRRLFKTVALVFSVSVLGISTSANAAASGVSAQPKVSTSVAVAKTRPLRELAISPPQLPQATGVVEAYPALPVPRNRPEKKGNTPVITDPVVQDQAPLDAKMPGTVVNFEGINNVNGVLPPDTVGDVGPGHYVQMVNLSYQVWDKSGTSLLGPLASNTIWSALPAGNICRVNNDGDPIVLYDQAADRWLLSQFALDFNGTQGFHQCIAISETGDPTGAFYLYDFKISDTKMNDYPHFGIWPDGYYMAVNQFIGNSWAGQGAVAFERDKMLAGLSAQMIYFDDPDPSLGAMLPADWDGVTPPPSGAPNLFVQLGGDNASLDIWAFHVDWTTPANATFTSLTSPAVASFDPDMCGGSRNCIGQPGGTAVDSLADRLMYRVQYRNFGGYEAMVTNHTVDANGADKAGVRWYELRNTGAGWTVANQGTYAPDADNRWLGSAAMDAQGNIAIGYSVSGANTYPSIRYTGRLVSDPADTLPQGEATLIAGGGSQSHSSGRWGDYSAMSVDPTDDCTFWYTQEYYSADSSAGWQTRIGSFKFPSCSAGPSGTLTGTVTSSGAPLEGVLVDAGGITTTTNASGVYNFASIPVGTYTVTASKFGYVTSSVSGVAVTDGATTIQDFNLAQASMTTISGTVTDGSGKGWPLYATIDIAGAPIPTLYTDPATGAYSVSLPQGANVTINVAVDGYVSQARGITVPAAPSTEDFAMLVDSLACSAPGYMVDGLTEDFNGATFPPSGWSVVDDAGNGVVWSNVAGSGESGNYTGGTGDAASVSSDAFGSAEFDTSLVSPVVPVIGGETLTYVANYQNYANLDFLDVDISVDGGAWTNVLRWNEDHGGLRSTPGEAVSLDLTGFLAGATSYQLRWHYYDPNTGDWDWYAQIDDVKAGGCVPDSSVGGLLVGNVYDANTVVPVNGATISHGSHASISMATPDDAALDDGFFSLPVPAGVAISVEATATGYGTATQSVTVPAGGVLRQNFALPAGMLAATPSPITMTLWEGMSWPKSLELANAGGADVAYKLFEFDVPYTAPQATGPWAEKVRHASPKHLHDKDARLLRYTPVFLNKGTESLPNPNAAGDILSQFVTGLGSPWGISFNKDANDLWVNNIGAFVGGTDDDNHRFLRDGTDTGDSITPTWMAVYVGDGAYDMLNGTLWQVNVGGDNCVYESDPVTLAPTGNSICPAFGTSMRGLAYDPVTDTFYAGSWNDSTIHHFDRSGTILDSKNVGLSISGLAFNPVTGHLFVLSNVDAAGGDDIAVLDVANDYAVLASFDTGIPDLRQGGLGMSCDGHLWAVQQATGDGAGDDAILEIDSGENVACLGIDWLSESPAEGTVAAGGSEPIEFTFDSTALTPGVYLAHVKVANDAPYGALPIPVEFTVIPYEQMFADVQPAHMFYNYVQSIGLAGITSGCDNAVPLPNYCDLSSVSRAQMAVFLGRGIHGSDYVPPPATGSVFNDVSASYWAAAWIEQFVADGMTSGCDGNGNYCPDDQVTRGQMAVFLLKAKHGASYMPPPASGTVFDDVDASYWSASWIEQLAAEGITLGCGGNNYCPESPVERGQMAVFIQRVFNLPIHP